MTSARGLSFQPCGWSFTKLHDCKAGSSILPFDCSQVLRTTAVPIGYSDTVETQLLCHYSAVRLMEHRIIVQFQLLDQGLSKHLGPNFVFY